MHVPQIVIRTAAALLAGAVVVTAWRAASPPVAYRASARIQIPEDPVTSVAGELEALGRQVAGTAMAVTRADDGGAIDVSLQSGDPAGAVQTVNTAVDTYLRTRGVDRTGRARALLVETTAAIAEQRTVVDRAEQERAAAQTLVARARRDRASAATQLKDIDASLARARARVAELAPVAVALRSGRSAESLSAVQAITFVRAMQERIAVLESEETALRTRFGSAHPEIARIRSEREKATAELQTELANLSATLLNDYDAATLERAVLEREREQVLRRPDVSLPSGGEFLSLSQRVDRERASLALLERRAQELNEVEGSPVGRADGAALVRPMVPPPARWPWVLGLLAAITAAWAARPLLRSIARTDRGGEG